MLLGARRTDDLRRIAGARKFNALGDRCAITDDWCICHEQGPETVIGKPNLERTRVDCMEGNAFWLGVPAPRDVVAVPSCVQMCVDLVSQVATFRDQRCGS